MAGLVNGGPFVGRQNRSPQGEDVAGPGGTAIGNPGPLVHHGLRGDALRVAAEVADRGEGSDRSLLTHVR
jgi:hypothetical protein